MDYEYYYYQAKNRYYDACSEINSCQNNVNNLEGNKQVKISGINNLKAQLKRYRECNKKGRWYAKLYVKN